VTLGVVTAVALHLASKYPRVPAVVAFFAPAPAAAVGAAALGMLGGVIAKLAESPGNRRHSDVRQKRELPP
jgi:anti-sigma factor RsiW